MNFHFDPQVVESLIGGLSIMDIGRLNIQSLEQAYEFIGAYGFDLNNEEDAKELWSYHRRAVTYLQETLLDPGDEFPEILSDPSQLKDIAYLLIYASTEDSRKNSLQQWACATMKVIHVLVHLRNDLFTVFSADIQDQILKPIQSCIYNDPVSGTFLGQPSESDHIPLKKFDLKPFKASDSSITKLLAKPEVVAFTVLDKIGVRFVTKHLVDTFRVMRYLVNKNLVSFPHNVPDQSNNTLYPANLFLEVMEGFTRNQEISQEEIDKILRAKLESAGERAQFLKKLNVFSSKQYQFIKFITRRRISVPWTGKDGGKIKDNLRFFYPFEVQIVDYETYLQNLSGPASHDKYKVRQRARARARVLGIRGDDDQGEVNA